MFFCKKYGFVYLFVIYAFLGSPNSHGDAYDILGVPRTATKSEIRKAYAKLVMKNRPD